MRPTLKDMERVSPLGAWRIYCDGSCTHPRLDHIFMGYTKKESLQVWKQQHPRN
jgi:hypothetical protein